MRARLLLAAAIVALLGLSTGSARADKLCTSVKLPAVIVTTCVPLP
jgi:hypothetical protein